MTEEKPFQDRGDEEENRQEWARQRGTMLRKAQAKQRSMAVYRNSQTRHASDPLLIEPMFEHIFGESKGHFLLNNCRNVQVLALTCVACAHQLHMHRYIMTIRIQKCCKRWQRASPMLVASGLITEPTLSPHFELAFALSRKCAPSIP